MSTDGSGSIGEEIRAARKGADLTIAEVANRAKLRSAVLQAIENDDFSLCGRYLCTRTPKSYCWYFKN